LRFMKMLRFNILLALILSFRYGWSQDCTSYFPMVPGAYLEIKHYDQKSKIISTDKIRVNSVDTTETAITGKAEGESFDEKGQALGKRTFLVKCALGTFYINMKSNLDMLAMSQFRGMKMRIESDDLDIPSDPQPGQRLKEGKLHLSLMGEKGQPVPSFNLTVHVYNRKVNGIDTIHTAAGTFDCIRISYDMKTFFLKEIITFGTEWYAKNVGVVRSEVYDLKGKLLGYNLLTSLKLGQ
jgi:hypothetical protein